MTDFEAEWVDRDNERYYSSVKLGRCAAQLEVMDCLLWY